MTLRAPLIVLLCATATLATVKAQVRLPPVAPRAIVIVGGTLVDGSGAAPVHNDAILVQNGRIARMGTDAVRRAPKDVRTIDATGKWVLPGLIDGHVHLFQTGGLDARPDFVPDPLGRLYPDIVDGIRRHPQPYLIAYVCSGVTSVADFGGPMWEFDLRESRRDDGLAPRIALAGPLLATYDPKPLEVGNDDPIWLMKDPAGVRAQVARIAAHRPEFIKVWFIHASTDDLVAQTTLVTAAIAAAHAHGLRAAVHATTLETARIAVDAGADVLVHSVSDREVDAAFVDAVVRRGVIYVPTLSVTRSYRLVRRRDVRFEPIERTCAPPKTLESFEALRTISDTVLSRTPLTPDSVPVQQRNLKRLADAGAVIAAGTDAGNTRTLHGPSLHREFALMAEAGLSPMQIIGMATRNGAKLLGREREIGQVKTGMLADLLVLDADPTADINNTRRIAAVIRGGALYQP